MSTRVLAFYKKNNLSDRYEIIYFLKKKNKENEHARRQLRVIKEEFGVVSKMAVFFD